MKHDLRLCIPELDLEGLDGMQNVGIDWSFLVCESLKVLGGIFRRTGSDDTAPICGFRHEWGSCHHLKVFFDFFVLIVVIRLFIEVAILPPIVLATPSFVERRLGLLLVGVTNYLPVGIRLRFLLKHIGP